MRLLITTLFLLMANSSCANLSMGTHFGQFKFSDPYINGGLIIPIKLNSANTGIGAEFGYTLSTRGRGAYAGAYGFHIVSPEKDFILADHLQIYTASLSYADSSNSLYAKVCGGQGWNYDFSNKAYPHWLLGCIGKKLIAPE